MTDLDLDELERLYMDDKTRPVGTTGQRDVLALIARVREAEARIEKIRKFVAPDMSYGHPEDDWEQGNKNALDAIYAALTEGDEQ